MSPRPASILLAAALAAGLAGLTAPGAVEAQLACGAAVERFEGGIPTGWSVVGDVATQPLWGDRGGCGEDGNFTAAGGNAACVSSDRFGIAPFASELRSPPFSLAGVATAALRYAANHQSFAGRDALAVEISADGGGGWTPLLVWGEDHGAIRSAAGERVEVDLSPWAGQAGLILRWRYQDPEADAFDWYSQVDDVRLVCDAPPVCAAPPIGGQVSDGGFEAGTPSPAWIESSSNFGTPICTSAGCGFAGAHAGDAWAFFGGADGAAETDAVEQSVTLDPGVATLTFQLWIPEASGNGADLLRVLLDGQQLFAVGEGAVAYRQRYLPVTVNLSAFADGGAHLLRFEGQVSGAPGNTNFFVDDVAIQVCSAVSQPPEMAVADVELVEGNSGSRQARFVVRLSAPSSDPVSVDYSTADGTALAGADYLATAGNLQMAVGDVEAEVLVDVLGETDVEDDEDFRLTLSNAVNATLEKAQAEGVILDDDSPPGIMIADRSLLETDLGSVDALFELVLSRESALPISVDYATAAGTATAGDDYLEAAGTVTFAPGSIVANLAVRIVGDFLGEPPETFFVDLSNPQNALIRDPQAQGTILNNDDPPEASIADASVQEGNTGSRQAVLTVSLSYPSHLDATFDYTTADGAATEGADYQATTGSLTIPALATSGQIAVAALGDTEGEDNEAFLVVLTNPVNASLADGEGQVTIVDDDNPDGTCAGANLLANPSADEPLVGGAVPGWTSVVGAAWGRGAVVPPKEGPFHFYPPSDVLSELAQDVDLSLFAGDIDAGTRRFQFEGFIRSRINLDKVRFMVEYRDAVGTVLDSFDSGEINSQGVWQRVFDERAAPVGTRVARVRLLGIRESTDGIDTFPDDLAFRAVNPPLLTAGDALVREGDGITVPVEVPIRLSCASQADTSVDYLTADGSALAGADYTAAAGSLVIPAGATEGLVPLEVLDDLDEEADEVFFLDLASPVNGQLDDPRGEITILDLAAPVLTVADVARDEGDAGLGDLVFVFALSNPFAHPVSIDWATTDGSARAGDDYLAAAGTVTVNPAETSAQVAVQIQGDTLTEGDETFLLQLSLPQNASLAGPAAEGRILNDDAVPVLTVGETGFVEGDRDSRLVQVPILLSAPTDRAVRVDYQVLPLDTAYDGVDFDVTSGRVSIAPGATRGDAEVRIYGDTLPEGDEPLLLQLSNAFNAHLAVTEAELLILEDDAACVGPDLVLNGGGEAGGGDVANWVEVSGDWRRRGGNSPLPLEGGVSIEPADFFTSFSVFELRQDVDVSAYAGTIAAGAQQFFFEGYVNAGGDDVSKIFVEYRDAAGGILASYASGPISNAYKWERVTHLQLAPAGTETVRIRLRSDEPRGFDHSLYDAISLRPLGAPLVLAGGGEALETAGEVQFEVALNCAAGATVTVDYATADGSATQGADYQAAAGSLSFAPGETEQTVAVALWDDGLAEGEEVLFLDLGNAAGAAIAAARGTGRILDDESPPSLRIADAKVIEGDAGFHNIYFGVSLSRPAALPVTVDYATANSSALAGEDYTAASGSLTFAPGSTLETLAIEVLGDEVNEGVQSFFVNLANPVGATLADAQAVGRIYDQDGGISMSIGDASVTEGDSGTRDMVFTVSLNRSEFAGDITVRYATVDGTAVAGSDYLPVSGELVIPASQTQGTIAVPIVGDEIYEPSSQDRETFRLNLSEVTPVEVTIADGSGLGTISEYDKYVNRFRASVRGGMTFVGNTLGLSGTNSTPTTVDRIGTFTTTDTALQVGTYPPGTTNDWRLNSSTAVLDLPAGAEVLHAELIWSATETGVTAFIDDPVTLVTPAAEHQVAPDPFTSRDESNVYSRSAEVTEQVAAAGPGTYEVRGVPGNLTTNTNRYNGWTLAVFYRDPAQPLRNLSLMVGWEDCTFNSNPLFQPLDLDVPERWPLSGRMAITAGEGDANRGDQFRLLPEFILGGADQYRLSGPNNPVGNFFLSQINDDQGLLETRGTFGDRNHASGAPIAGGRQGWDITQVDVSRQLAAGDREAWTSVSCWDVHVFGFGFQIDAEAAVFPGAVKTVDRAFARAGELLTYTVDLRNEGSVAAEAVTFTDPPPAGTQYVAGSLTADGLPVPGADPAAGVPLGTIAAGANLVLSFEVELLVLPPEELPAEYRNRASWTYLYREAPDQAYRAGSVSTNEVLTRNEDAALLEIDDLTVTEGAADMEAVFTVDLSAPLGFPVTVDYATVAGTAVELGDFLARSGALTFASGELSKTITVPIVDDALAELTESFTVVLSTASGVPILEAEGVATILDDDVASVSIGDVSLIEGNSGSSLAVFTVSQSNVTGQVVTVDYLTEDGSATAGSDYLAQAGTLVFDPGVGQLIVAVEVLADLLDEPDESFTVRLTSPANAALGDDLGLATIVDDDGPLDVTVGDTSVFEGDQGTSPTRFSAAIPFPVVHDVTVDFVTADDTAAAGVDYVATAGTVLIPAGETAVEFTVDVFGDAIRGPSRQFFVDLSNPQPHNVGVSDPRAVGLILDDDPLPRVIVADAAVVEGDAGTVDALFEVTIDGASSEPIALDFETWNGYAEAGSDFVGRTGTLIFAPGETVKMVAIEVNGDLDDETDESFFLRLTDPGGVTFLVRSTAEGFITDDDDDGACLGTNLLANPGGESTPVDGLLPDWTVAADSWLRATRNASRPQPAEGFWFFEARDSASPELFQDVDMSRFAAAIDGAGLEFRFAGFVATRQAPPTFASVVVEYRDAANATVLDAYDTGPLNNSPDAWLSVADQRLAPAGTRFVRVRLLCGGTASNSRCNFDGLVLRTAGTPALAVLDASVPEGDAGLTPLELPVVLSCAAPAPASAAFATADGGAFAGLDYQATSGSVALDPGETAETIRVDVFGDVEGEPDEELFVDLSAVTGALPGRPRGRGVIVNDDPPAMDLALCLDASGSVDNAQWNLQKEGLALAVENPAVLPHNNSIRLTVLQFGTGAQLDIGPVIVNDANAAELAAQIRALGQNVGSTNIAACIDLATQVLTNELPIALKRVIDISTDGGQTLGNAIRAANDAVAAGIDALNAIGIGSGINVSFLRAMVRPQPEGGSDGFVVLAPNFQIYVNAIQDKIRKEVSPDLAVQIDDGVTVAAPGDPLTYQVLVTNSGSGSVTAVTLSDFVPAELQSPVYTPSEGGFDPATGEWTGVLLESGTSLSLTVAGTIDPAVRGSLVAPVTVSPPVGVVDLDPSDNSDSHTTPLVPSVDLTLAKAAVGPFIAGQTATYLLDVTSAGPSQTDGPVELTDQLPVALGFVGAAGVGWSCGAAGQSVTCTHPGPLAPGGALPQVQLMALIAESVGPTVTNTASVSGPEEDPLPGNNVAAVVTPVEGIPALAIGDASVLEGDSGSTAVTLTVVLSAPSSREARVAWATVDGSAAAGADYTAAAGTLVFPPGGVQQTIQLDVLGDTVYEEGESFLVDLSGPENARLFDPQGLVAILDDDAPPVLSIDDATLQEGDSGLAQAVFTVSLTGSTAIDARVDFFTADGSAVAVEDYLAAAGTLTVPFGTGSATLVVEVVGDPVSEPDETFFVQLENPENATLADAEGVGTILDDDLGLPELSASKEDTLASDNDGDGVASPGDVLRYTITVVNSTGAAATGVELNDLIPANTTLVPGSVTTSQGTVVSEDPVVVALGEVLAGTPATVSFEVTVANPVPAGVMEVVNQGTVTSVELPAVLTDDPALGGDADPTVTMIQAAPNLVAEKVDTLAADGDGDTVPSPGDTIEYTVSLINTGNTSATGVAFSDAIPAHTTVVPGSVTASQGTVDSEDPVQVTVGEIPGGDAVVTVSFRVVIDNPVPAGVTAVVNQGAATSAELPPVLTDDPDFGGDADPTETMIRAEPELVVEKTDVLFTDADGDGVVSPGDELLYSVTVTNTGNTSATAVALTDPVPANTAVVPGTVQTSQGLVVSEDPVSADLGGIAGGGAEAVVTFRVAIDDPFPSTETAVANQATVSSAELPDVPSDDPDTPAASDPTASEVFITPAIAVADATELEAAAAVDGLVFALSLAEPSNREVRVDYVTADGTALAGLDYQAGAGTVIFAPGETAATVVVAGLDDLLDEPDETFHVLLSDPVQATLPDPAALGTILDDDAAPLAVIDDVTVTEGDAGTVQALFTVTLSAPSSFAVAIDYATADLSATAGADYQAAAGTLQIPAGAVTAAIPVDVLGDLLDEPDETFRVLLSNPVQVVLADPEGVGTILDDDPPEMTVDDVEVVEGASGELTPAVFTIALSSPAEGEVTVDYTTADGTAAAGADYEATAGTLTIPVGDSSGEIVVNVVGDGLLEDDETFTLELSGAVNARIVDGVGLGTILDDEDCPGLNLLRNPGAEADLLCGGLPDWLPVQGGDWQARYADPGPFEGQAYFWAGLADVAELRQDVDVAAYAPWIAAGDQTFRFIGRVRTFDEVPGDTARIVVEYRDTSNSVVLDAWDSGEITSPTAWQEVGDERPAPAGTGWIRVRLLAARLGAAPEADGYFDALSLVSLRLSVVTAGDVAVLEGDVGAVAAVFPLTLHCAVGEVVPLTVKTADGSALAGEDYQALAPTDLAFTAGASELLVPVAVYGDLEEEPDETFTLLLSNAPAAVLLDPEAEGTILDDDTPAFCQRSPGYWKNHPEAWPVETLRLGCGDYDASGLLALLRYGGPDAATRLARHLTAAKLNLAAGSEPSIVPVVDEADRFLAAWPPGSNPRGDERREANRIKNLLDDYNNADCEGD